MSPKSLIVNASIDKICDLFIMPAIYNSFSMTPEDKLMVIERYARGKEDILIESYIIDGPMALKVAKGFSPEEWDVIFDYLVFNHALLYKTVIQNLDFFSEEYVLHGMAHLREMFDVVDEKYEQVWVQVFDFIAIANGALYEHVLHHRDRYMIAMKARNSDFVRKVLGVWNSKYNESWEKILNTLLHAVCDAIFTENTFERGLITFTRMFNGMREHRPLLKHDLSKRF